MTGSDGLRPDRADHFGGGRPFGRRGKWASLIFWQFWSGSLFLCKSFRYDLMRIEPEIGAASIVLLGSFNPKIFQPYWMAKHGLISDSEAEAADVAVIHPEITAFMIEYLFTVQVNPTRFSIERNVAPLVLSSPTLALSSKCLAQSNKSRTGGKATNKQNADERVATRPRANASWLPCGSPLARVSR